MIRHCLSVFSEHSFYQRSRFGKGEHKDANTKFINHIDNTLHYNLR